MRPNVAPLIGEFTGQSPAHPRSPAQLQAAYEVVIDSLLPGMGAASIVEREAPQQTLERICYHAGRPGAEVERAALCRAMACRLGPDTAKPARVWLLRQLERISGQEAVGAVAALLAEDDPEIRDLARRVLQNNPADAAGATLGDALQQTGDPEWKVALINALAARHDEAHLPQLIGLSRTDDPSVSAAAVAALGEIGSLDAHLELYRLWSLNAEQPSRDAIAAAWLRCADRLVERGLAQQARGTYETLFESGGTSPIRAAALRGLTVVSGTEVLPRLLAIIADDQADSELRAMAAGLAAEIPGFTATAMLAAKLSSVSPSAQVLMLGALADRDDSGSEPAVIAMLKSDDQDVRIAALQALGHVGRRESALPLAQAAAAATGAEQDAARKSLARLRGEGIDEEILATLEGSSPSLRVNLIRALAARQYRVAIPVLLGEARHEDESVRAAAFEALGALASESDAAALVALLVNAEPEAVRDAAIDATVAVCRRIEDAVQRAELVLAAWDEAGPTTRASLVQVLGRVGGPMALDTIRNAVRSADGEVVDAAVHALAKWPSAEVLNDLLDIVQHSENKTHRVLALQGYVRLLGQPSDREPGATVEMYKTAMSRAERTEEQKLVLGGLGQVRHLDALRLTEQYVADESLRAEAEAAVIASARLVAPLHGEEARAAIDNVLNQTTSDASREAAEKALEFIRSLGGYLMDWTISGPYFEKGREWSFVSDQAFAPETSKRAAEVEWQPLQITSADKPWVFDLSGIGGEHRCVYVRSAVWSQTRQAARLEVGSDDGVKVWLNGRLVHEFRGPRSHEPLQDKVPVTLEPGRNTVLLKVVQIDGGWGFSCAIRSPDGTPLDGLTTQEESAKP